MDYAFSTYDAVFFMARRHPVDTSQYLTLVHPFSGEVWLAWCVSILALYLTMVLISRTVGAKSTRDLFEILRRVFGVMINESMPKRFMTLVGTARSHALLLVFWVPLACLIGMGYQSTLLSALVKVSKEKPIDTFEQILEQGTKMYVYGPSIMPSLFKTNPSPVMKEAYERLGVHHKAASFEDNMKIIEEVLEGGAVWMTTIMRMNPYSHLVERGRKLTVAVIPCLYRYGINNPVLAESDRILGILLSAGIYRKFYTKYFVWRESFTGREAIRNNPIESASSPLGIQHVVAMFFLVSMCLCLSAMSFAVEYWLVWKKQRKSYLSRTSDVPMKDL